MPSEPNSANRETASVLVVDDTLGNLIALRTVLRPLGVRVVEARSGAEALERVREETFAVVLLDVQMPEMDGFETAKRIRSIGVGREVPIIFLTAIYRDEAYARVGYASGAADYITKPFDPDVLRARVRAFVDLFHQRERLRREQVGERTRERDEALDKLAALLESERAARHEAEIANGAKDDFLAMVSHELRTPLSAILGWVQVARRHSSDDEALRALSNIERNARAQLGIIEDVLDVGRGVRGSLRLEVSDTRVADVVDSAVLAVRHAADAKHIALDLAVDEDVGVIMADADRLRQIVTNLLSNAIKFTPSGGHVAVSARRLESSVRVCVRDDGEGIRSEFLPHVFEPFRQGDSSTARRHGGVGLGLAIVKQLVDAHGGQIRAESEGEGKGAVFSVELPIRREPQERHEETSLSAPSARLDQVRLLLVDDDEDSRELVAYTLVEYGANVASAASAAEALDLLDQGSPDVILSDISMPEVDGYALIRSVRARPAERGGATPAVALTAHARESDGERAIAAGFQAHVAKPIVWERLVAVVAQLASAAR
jgi:signal transduction histidine kinase